MPKVWIQTRSTDFAEEPNPRKSNKIHDFIYIRYETSSRISPQIYKYGLTELCMERQPFVLGFILRKFPEFIFTMDNFDDRLRLQKFIYLLQAHDVYLGYDYTWYLRGPYCTTLATAGFALDDIYDRIQGDTKKTRFVSQTIQKRFDKFTRFIRGKERNTRFLEAAASLHFLLKTQQISEEKAVDRVIKKMPDADERSVREVLKEMRTEDLV